MADFKKIEVTQVRSGINCPEVQKRTLLALGLKKLNRAIEHDASPAVMGMIRKVNHLVKYTDK